MEENHLYCPKCRSAVPADGPDLLISFTPISAKLDPGGGFDWGYPGDTFFDYWHVPCGAQVRFVSGAGWVEEVGRYVTQSDPFLEIHIDGEYVSDADMLVFSGKLSDDPANWGPTFATLQDMLQRALEQLHHKEETE